MATLNCTVCGKRMVTPRIMELHMKKWHAVPETVEEKAVVEVQPTEEKEMDSLVTIKSADGRKLEVSVGERSWNSTEIQVPKDMVGEIRRILLDGGYFLKD